MGKGKKTNFKSKTNQEKSMKKCFAFFTALLFTSQIVHAQLKKDTLNNTGIKSLMKIELSNSIGIKYEQKIGKLSTISLYGGVKWGFAADGFSFQSFKKQITFLPDSHIEYRYYYNFNNRKLQEKTIQNNSANFLFFNVAQFYPVKNQNYFGLLFTEGWGLQRRIFKNFTYALQLGITQHIYYDKPPSGGFNYVLIEPLTGFSFSYSFLTIKK